MGYDDLETDTESLKAFALDDAINTLTGEQVAYWADGKFDQPGYDDRARRSDLKNWLDCEGSEREWQIYKQAFEAAMRAGIAICDKVEFTENWGENDEEEETINAAVDAAKAAVA